MKVYKGVAKGKSIELEEAVPFPEGQPVRLSIEPLEENSLEGSPTALRIGPYRVYFYSYDCAEPRHMHVDRENRSAKFWLDPDVALADNRGYSRRELREIERVMTEHREDLRYEWDAFCSGSTEPA